MHDAQLWDELFGQNNEENLAWDALLTGEGQEVGTVDEEFEAMILAKRKAKRAKKAEKN